MALGRGVSSFGPGPFQHIDSMDFSRWGGKRFNPISRRLKEHFGCKVYRVSVDAGFTCPNRDGTLGAGGCIYCGERGAASIGAERSLSIERQLKAGMSVMRDKNRAEKFIAYFQSFTNTYEDLSTLRRLYNEALSTDDVVGLAISTRPDCLTDEILDLLEELNGITYLWLEIGMQTIHDRSLALINRGHTFDQFLKSYEMAGIRKLRVCVHSILGLPGESYAEMMETGRVLGALAPEGVKLHLLHALKDTPLAEMYEAGKWRPMEMEEYINLVCDIIEKLHPETTVHRLTGDPLRGYLVAPRWSTRKWEVLNGIDIELTRRGGFQGRLFSEKGAPPAARGERCKLLKK